MPSDAKKKKKGKDGSPVANPPAPDPTADAPATDQTVGATTDDQATNLESSVRLSEDVHDRYTEMADEDKTQKTTVLERSILRLAETVAENPNEFRGKKRPGRSDPPPPVAAD